MKETDLKTIAEGLIETFNIAGKEAVELYKKGLKIDFKEDKSPVSNGDLRVNEIICNKIKELTPNIPIISEETVDIKKKNKFKVFWLIDPIDGTREYIAGKNEYTTNAALIIDQVPRIGLVGAPKKNRLFYSYGKNQSYLIQSNKLEKIHCLKKTKKKQVVALSSASKPSEIILNKLREYNVTSIVKMASSYKFCVIAAGEFDIYAAREKANEWDYAAGHAIAMNAGATITTLEGKAFLYGKEDYKNPSILILRSNNLND